MVLKAASILAVLLTLNAQALEKDWVGIVQSLKPKKGQNFEQDLQFAKALFALERRIEAIQVINHYPPEEHDESTKKLIRLMSTQFFSQETATGYYEAVKLIGLLKWAEAYEKLEWAIAREPGHGLILLRLIQVELLLKKKDSRVEHLRLALALTPEQKELKMYLARAHLDDGDSKEAARIFNVQKSIVQQNEVLTVWWLQSLAEQKKSSEFAQFSEKVLKKHSNWSYVIDWCIRNRVLSEKMSKLFTAQLEKNLKEPEKFNQSLEVEAKRTQYFWVGYYSLESLKLPADSSLNLPQSKINETN
jgi:predicted Zn-dependent protease